MSSTRITSKCQITVPREVRETLGVGKGDRLRFDVSRRGRVTVRGEEERPVTRLLGRLARYRKKAPVTLEKMAAAVRRRVVTMHRKPPGR